MQDAETCTRLASLWEDDPLVVGAYVFGELLEGAQRPERLQLALRRGPPARGGHLVHLADPDGATHGYLDLLAATRTAGST